jgi:hypothetical protein
MLRMLSVVALAWGCLAACTARAEDLPDSKPETPEIAAAREHVTKFVLQEVRTQQPIERVEKPILLYGDATRASEQGSLWAFGKTGRPAVLVELFRMKDGRGADIWVYGLTRTTETDVRLRLPADSSWSWTPPKSDLAFRPLSGMKMPDATPAGRLRQMKEASRRFSAHEFWELEHSRFELRLLIQPVHRYDDPSRRILDGAVFVFAHGTNPEVTLFLEALQGKNGAEWQYAVGRSCQAEFHVLQDEKEVHSGPRLKDSVGDREAIWLGSRPVASTQ